MNSINCIFCNSYCSNNYGSSFRCPICLNVVFLTNYNHIDYIEFEYFGYILSVRVDNNLVDLYNKNNQIVASLKYLPFISPQNVGTLIDKMLNLKAFQ